MRRVANRVALGLLNVPSSTMSGTDFRYEPLLIAACDLVGSEAAEIKTFPEDFGKTTLLLGMVRQELEILRATRAVRCTLTPKYGGQKYSTVTVRINS